MVDPQQESRETIALAREAFEADDPEDAYAAADMAIAALLRRMEELVAAPRGYLARKLSRNTAPSGRLTAAQKHEASRKAGDMATSIEAVQWATCDLSPRDLLGVITALFEARPDLTRDDLEAIERHIGRLSIVAGGHRLDDIARRGEGQ